MLLLPSIRSLIRGAFGWRLCQRDLDVIIAEMQGRLLKGKLIWRPSRLHLSPEQARRRLQSLQLRKLRNTVDYLQRHVPYYRRALAAADVSAKDLRSLADLQRLPITRRTDLQAALPDFVSRAPGLVPSIRITTSGTTGRPMELFLTQAEFQYYASVQAIAGMTYGFLGPGRMAQVHLPLDLSIAAQLYTAAARMSGSLVLNLGLAGTLDKHIDSLLAERSIQGETRRVTDLYAAPGFLWALTARAEQRGIGPAQSPLRRVFAAGAMVSDALKARVLKTWGVRLFEGYSMIETPGTGAFECEHGRMHFVDFSAIVEFLDPGTMKPVNPGETGIAVITTFYPDRELMPVIRYWSDDLMRTPQIAFCPCGNVSTSIEDILGRADHMVTVGGQNFYPQVIGDALVIFPELVQPPRFRFMREQHSDVECAVVEVEGADAAVKDHRLVERIRAALPISDSPHVVAGLVKVEVRLVPAGSLKEPFCYKLQAAEILPPKR